MASPAVAARTVSQLGFFGQSGIRSWKFSPSAALCTSRAISTNLEANGFPIVRIDGFGLDAPAVAQTLDAMRAGVPIIAQGALQAARWGGRVDILQRVDKPSDLGAWSYEVIDTKLARETKGNTVLQICLYSDLLRNAQKIAPEFAHVVTPGSDFKPRNSATMTMPRTIVRLGIAWKKPPKTAS
jgi:predicted RecB family nuclease